MIVEVSTYAAEAGPRLTNVMGLLALLMNQGRPELECELTVRRSAFK